MNKIIKNLRESYVKEGDLVLLILKNHKSNSIKLALFESYEAVNKDNFTAERVYEIISPERFGSNYKVPANSKISLNIELLCKADEIYIGEYNVLEALKNKGLSCYAVFIEKSKPIPETR